MAAAARLELCAGFVVSALIGPPGGAAGLLLDKAAPAAGRDSDRVWFGLEPPCAARVARGDATIYVRGAVLDPELRLRHAYYYSIHN
jgi:hypothetical protein